MVKQKSSLKNVPRKYLAIGLASIVLNVLVFATLVVGQVVERTGMIDYALVNDGIARMCSDEFKKTVEKSSRERGESENDRGLQLASLDYSCGKNDAKDFYKIGFDQYVRTLGLKPQE